MLRFQGLDRRLLIVLLMLASLVAMPFLALIVLSFGGFDARLWLHLHRTVLWPAVGTTLMLMMLVGVAVTLIGVATAWLVSVCRFPGRNILSFALLLPLALPTYVSAFAYIEFLGFSGPLQSAIRALFGYQSVRDYWFPDYRSVAGAALVMSLVLYPYVYLTARASFTMQTASLFDASRTLGAGPWKLFFKIALPLARPAIIVGLALALMETVNDLGAVQFFGLRTLTTTVYEVWLNRSSLATASQIACLFLGVVVLLLWFERHARRAQRLYQNSGKSTDFEPITLHGARAVAAFAICALPVAFGFLVPVAVLGGSALRHVLLDGISDLAEPIVNSVSLGAVATLVTVSAGCFFAYLVTVSRSTLLAALVRFSTLGYAVPGAVLAVGVLYPLATFDNAVDGLMRATFGWKTGLILSGTGFALVYAYFIRFLPMAYGSCETGFQRLSPNFGFAARTLGRTQSAVLREIYLPLLQPALVTAAILVFVDCMKELPATLLLRPFNFNTLATRVYDSASLEVFEQGALPALAIVAVGLVPVILLSRQNRRILRRPAL